MQVDITWYVREGGHISMVTETDGNVSSGKRVFIFGLIATSHCELYNTDVQLCVCLFSLSNNTLSFSSIPVRFVSKIYIHKTFPMMLCLVTLATRQSGHSML